MSDSAPQKSQPRESPPPPPEDEARLEPLLDLVRRLRAPDGCPWDREQTLSSVRAYLLEEAHEAAAAIDEVAMGEAEESEEDGEAARRALAEELGDLLFQVAFVGVLQEEAGGPGLGESICGVHRKMVRRHPHVFGDEGGEIDADAVVRQWERRKSRERDGETSLLDGVPDSLPSLVAALRLTQKAAGVGFDWPDVGGVVAKIREELAEVEEHLGVRDEGQDEGALREDALRDEIGDLLFSVANLARRLDLDPEAALAGTNRKFRRRFRRVEETLRRRGRALADAELEEMDALWEAAKEDE